MKCLVSFQAYRGGGSSLKMKNGKNFKKTIKDLVGSYIIDDLNISGVITALHSSSSSSSSSQNFRVSYAATPPRGPL